MAEAPDTRRALRGAPSDRTDADPTRPGAQVVADLWGVLIDGEDMPVMAQSPRAASVLAAALYVDMYRRSPETVGRPRLWQPLDVARFVAAVDAQLERARFQGGAPVHPYLVELRDIVTRDAGAGQTWVVTPAAPPVYRQVEPYLWRNLLAAQRHPMLLGNTARVLYWFVSTWWPKLVGLLYLWGWFRWDWPAPHPAVSVLWFLLGWWYVLASLADTLPWAVEQFTLFPEDAEIRGQLRTRYE